MAGSPPLPPDGFFPTRRNPEFQSDRFFGASHGVFPAFQAMDSIQCESEQQQPMLKRPRLTDETPSPHNGFPIPAMQPAAANPAQNSKNNPFFKTRPCRAFDNGHCVHGNGCLFAHGPGELRQPLPGWESAVPKEQPSNAVQSQRKKICRRYEREQECPYGDSCVFLHDSSSQRMSRRPDAGLHSWEPGSSSNSSARLGCYSAADNSEAKTAFWKTKLCHKFEKYGHCPFGDKCQYAHGAAGTYTYTSHHSNISICSDLKRAPVHCTEPALVSGSVLT